MSRISSLPRRDWTDGAVEVAAELTRDLRTSYGTMALRPIQGVSLLEAAERRGLFCNARVGGGKTLISFLLPVILGARRPLLLLPASRVEITKTYFRELAKHWASPDLSRYRIESYQWLSMKQNATMLQSYAPDLIVADEAHKLKHLETSAVARRVGRYLSEAPDTMFCPLSGTLVRGSILDSAHLMVWALKNGAPVPKDRAAQEVWASALDVAPTIRLDDLTPLCADLGPMTNLVEAQRAYHDRVCSTPGVIVSRDAFKDVELTTAPVVISPPAALDAAFADLREVWTAPDGWLMADARFEVWAVARQLALGFYYRHDPWPPDDWFAMRRKWCKIVRTVIQCSDEFDTEAQVIDAAERGDLGEEAELIYREWLDIEPTFEIHKVATWLSDHALVAAERWGKERRFPGIIWTHHAAFAEELSRQTSWAHFGPDGLDRKKRFIENVTDKIIIASAQACGTGSNLQHHYSDNLVASPMTGAEDWEQLIGRTHREGAQRAVHVDYFVASNEHITALQQSMRRAEFTINTMGTPQKILDSPLEIPYNLPRPDHQIWAKTQGQRT